MFRRSILLGLLAIAGGTQALQLRAKDDDEKVDRYGQVQVQPRATFAAAGLATVAATALQVVSPSWLQQNMACDNALCGAVLRCVSFIDRLKTTNPLGLTMGHGMLLKAIAEVLAQVIPQGMGASAWLDPLRIARSTIASLLSSSLTFYYWTRLDFVRRLAAPGWLSRLLGRGLGTSLTKMVVTQVSAPPPVLASSALLCSALVHSAALLHSSPPLF